MDPSSSHDGLAEAPASMAPPALQVEAVSVQPLEPRFCGTCGEAWVAGASECAFCAERASRRAAGRAAGPSIECRQFRSPLGMYFGLLALSIIGIVAAVAGASELSVQIAVSTAHTIVVLVWCLTAERNALRLLLRPASFAWLGVAAGAGLLTFGLASLIIYTLHVGLGLEILRYSKPFLEAGHGWGLIVLMIVVQPALIEELAFRGVVLGSLRPALSDTEAVLVSASLFMILHLTPAAFPHTFVMGVAAGLLRLRCGSLLPCVLMHFVHNGLCIAMERAGW